MAKKEFYMEHVACFSTEEGGVLLMPPLFIANRDIYAEKTSLATPQDMDGVWPPEFKRNMGRWRYKVPKGAKVRNERKTDDRPMGWFVMTWED